MDISSLNIPDACHKLVSKMKFSSVVKYANQMGYDVTTHTDRKEVYSLVLYSVADMFFVLPSRIIHKNIIQKRLEDMELEDGEACLDDKKLMKVINIGHFLGSGKYGAVYFATLVGPKGKKRSKIQPTEFVLKLSAIPTKSYNVLKSGWKRSHPWDIPFRTKEIVVHYLINSLLTENICPNFIFMYHWYLCNKCSHLQVKKEGVKVLLEPQECIIYILEKVDEDFSRMALQDSKKWSHSKKEKIYQVAIFQTLMALATLQKYYAIDHNDAGFRNIFFKKINRFDNRVTYWTYIFNNNTYHVPNPGYMFFLADYGLSQSLRMLGQTTTEPDKSVVGKVGKDTYYRIYNDETDEITYSPSGMFGGILFLPDHNSDKYHTQDKGLAVLTSELGVYFKNGEIQDIQDYLNQIFIDKTGKTVAKLREKKLAFPPVDYSDIFDDLFKEWKTPPKDGICIGVYDADKPLPFNVDEKYLEILRTKIY